MHAQEVAQEVLAPQEHASGEKKLNCALSARSSTRKKIKILSARSRKKLRVLPQTANNRKKFTVVCLISNRQIYITKKCLRQTRTAKCNSDFAPFSVKKRQKTSTCIQDNANNLTSLRKRLKSRGQKFDFGCSTFT